MAEEHPSSPPHKKVKLADAHPTTAPITPLPRMKSKEEDVGITAFVNPEVPGFSGLFKKRYTDFLVNEVLPSGEVVHLVSTRAPFNKQQTPDKPQGAPATKSEVETIPPVTQGQESKPDAQAKVATEPKPETQTETPTETTQPVKTAGQDGDTQIEAPANGSTATAAGNAISAWQQFSATHGNLTLSPRGDAELKALVDDQTVSKILALFNKIIASPDRRAREHGSVVCPIIDDKEKRTSLHRTIRALFKGRLESITDDDGAVVVHAAAQPVLGRGGYADRGRGAGRGRGGRDRGGFAGNQRNNRPSFQELGGDYVHFTLYKENRDTMEVIAFLARELHIKPQQFQFAGTKDRRGVTVQRVSVYRIFVDRLIGIAKKGRGWKLGDYEYKPYALSLGDLTGNEFTITLRDCQGHENVAAAIEALKRGYINYYGMQRFGTFATRTDTVGVHLLKGDFEAAVAAILKYPQHCLDAAQNPESPEAAQVGSDDKDRALAIYHYEQGDNHKALSILPRKFSAENQLIRHLGGRNSSGDYYGAIQTIQRNLRLMYVHAYQSLIWNLAATHRWNQFGDKVMEGDLVMVNEHKDDTATKAEAAEEIDADGEVVIQPTSEDRAMTNDDRFERARALTAEEASSGKYTTFDIVLPTPGYDILYPAHLVKFYEETMAKDEYGNLNPHDMRRKWRDVSLSGSYRKLLARVEGIEYEVKEYKNENEQFVETDADKLAKANNRPSANTDNAAAKQGEEMQTDEIKKPTKTAIVLKFQLGSSQYATMALRELMKGGLETYKVDFSGGR